MSRIAFRNFTGGEVTPTLSARYDLQKFGTFLQCCENFIPNIHGDIERRPGTRFVSDLGRESVLLPFQFNTEPENNYVLIFQEDVIRVATASGLIEGVNIASPYALADVYELSFAQAGDVVYLAHKKYPLHKLMRFGNAPDYEWALQEVALNVSLPAPGRPTATWHRGPKNSESSEEYTQNETSVLRYKVTAVGADGVESLASPECEVTARFPTDWVQGDYVEVTWESVPGAAYYNIYRESAGYYGFVGTIDATGASGGTLINIKVGEELGRLVNYSGSITRTIEKVEGMVGDSADHHPSDTTSDLIVIANPAQPAFFAEGKLFVRVTKTTKTYLWENVEHSENSDQVYYEWERSLISESTEKIWAMVTPRSEDDPSGAYAEYVAMKSEGSTVNNDAPNGIFGPYTVIPVYEGATTLTFQDQNYEPDTSMTPKEDWNPFEGENNPATVTFHQQRLVLGGTRDNPASFYMSRTGDFENFRKSRPLQDDDPVEYMLASGSIDDIRWVASFGDLLIGTSGAEYTATSNGAAITSSDVQISTESFWGSSGLQPIVIGNSVLHCQRSGHHVRDLAYSWEKDGYAGNDLSLLAPEIVETHGIIQWAFQQSPGSNIWCARDDGVLLCLTYMKEQNVFAWSRHETAGRVLSVASISGSREDVVLFVVEREFAGKKRYFLERLAPRLSEDRPLEQAVYVDCSLSVTREEASREVDGLGHLEGAEVVALADGSPAENLTVKDGKVELPYPAKVVTVGLNYTSVLSPLPIEADMQTGSSLGKRRAYGKVVLRLHRTVGGSYAATRAGDLFKREAWKEREFFDLPFVPERYDEPCALFSGDVELSLPGGQDADTSVILKQDRPMPFRLVGIMAEVDFGEV